MPLLVFFAGTSSILLYLRQLALGDPITGWRVCQGSIVSDSLSLSCRSAGYWPTFDSILAPMCRFILEVYEFAMESWICLPDRILAEILQWRLNYSQIHMLIVAISVTLCETLARHRIRAHVQVCTSLSNAMMIPWLHWRTPILLKYFLCGFFALGHDKNWGRRRSCLG